MKAEQEKTSTKIVRCAACGKTKTFNEMKVCMDSRQMHRYVCDSKCMVAFYS